MQKNSKYLFSVVVILLLAPIVYFSGNNKSTPDFSDSAHIAAQDGNLCIKYIDVGQGDSELIRLPDGETILIDAGEKKNADAVVSTLNDMSVTKIDYLIATHPHADHIGGMSEIVEDFEIGKVYMPRADHDSQIYLALLEAIDRKGLKITEAKAGTSFISGDNIDADFLAPSSEVYSSLNDYSAVVKLKYKNNSFLFTGDAETLSESEMLGKGYDLSADVLKVGHHGSKTSTSAEFLNKVNPKYAIISCGVNNKYSHPSEETLEKLSAKNINVFRTDLMGTITLYSDGDNISFEVKKNADNN